MSLIAVVASIIVVVCYALAVQEFFHGKQYGGYFDWYTQDDHQKSKVQKQDRAQAITAIILALGLAELLVSLMSLVHGLMCCCCRKWHQVSGLSVSFT